MSRMVRLHITRNELYSILKMTVPATFLLVVYILIESMIESLDIVTQMLVLIVLGGLTMFVYRKALWRLVT